MEKGSQCRDGDDRSLALVMEETKADDDEEHNEKDEEMADQPANPYDPPCDGTSSLLLPIF